MEFNYKNLNSDQIKITLPLNKDEFEKIKDEVNGCNLLELEHWEFWDLRDYFFNKLIIENFKEDLISLFTKTHLNEFDFSNKDKIEIKVIDLYYHYYYNEVFICSEPSNVIYPDIEINRLEIRLKYDTDELEYLLEQILDAFGVIYNNWKEEGTLLCTDEFNIGEYFSSLMINCWTKVKLDYNSNVIGFVSYASGGGGYTDLDNGNEVEETIDGIKAYLKNRIKN